MTVPVVELGRGDAVAVIDAACRESGFFVVVGHGLGAPLASVFTMARRLFALPDEVKRALAMTARNGYLDDGAKELYDVGLDHGDDAARWPAIDGFRAAIGAYQQAALGVAAAILESVAAALDVERSFFADRMGAPECYLRLLRYRASTADPLPTRAHTDYGAITLLATDGGAGLQAAPRGSREWIDVVAPPGALVVNLGDMLARWTNDRYASTPHRVIGASGGDRYSVPFFVNPDPGTMVECVPTCVDASHPCRYPPVTATEFLQGRIDGTITVALP